jgi:hypothetical protein
LFVFFSFSFSTSTKLFLNNEAFEAFSFFKFAGNRNGKLESNASKKKFRRASRPRACRGRKLDDDGKQQEGKMLQSRPKGATGTRPLNRATALLKRRLVKADRRSLVWDLHRTKNHLRK